jgi:hypothetical protein
MKGDEKQQKRRKQRVVVKENEKAKENEKIEKEKQRKKVLSFTHSHTTFFQLIYELLIKSIIVYYILEYIWCIN